MIGPEPLVSVITTTYRREQQVVDAVRSALEQGGSPLEVLVIDDTPERTAEAAVLAIGDPRVRSLGMEEPSGGRPALVRNAGIARARGSYLYFLDDDDRVAPRAIDHLDHLVYALQRHPRKGVAYGRVTCFGPDAAIRDRYNKWFGWAGRASRRIRWSSWLTCGVNLFRGTLIINSACMIRKDAAVRIGGYDPEIPVYEDVDFFNRGIRQFGHVFVDSPVLQYGTGKQSVIHDLHEDGTLVHESYVLMHRHYRERHGTLEYRALQVLSKVLPLENARATQ
jgi:glycosyltransferase involved in cell wall biosynthesis